MTDGVASPRFTSPGRKPGRRRYALSALLLPRNRGDWGAWTGWGVAVALGLTIAFPLTGWGGASAGATVTEVAYAPLGLGCLILAWRASRQPGLESRAQRAWLLIAAALALQVQAHTTWSSYDTIGQPRPFPSWADAASLAFVPLVLAGLLTLPVPRRPSRHRGTLPLDVATVLTGGFMVVWYLVLGPTLTGPGPAGPAAGTPFTVAVSAAYPVGDLLLIFGLALTLLRGVSSLSRRPLYLLGAGVALFVGADLCHGYAGLHADFAAGRWPDLLRLTAAALFAAAAHDQYRHAPQYDQERRRAHAEAVPVRPAHRLPYVAVAAAYGLLLLIARGQDSPRIGVLLGAAGVLTVAVALRQFAAVRESRALAVTDALTGLASRAWAQECLDDAVARTRSTGGQVAVLMIDLDGFGSVNDSMGHQAGDAVLIAAAQAISSVTRFSDTAGRLGGDEFVVILDDIDGPLAAESVAQRVQAALSTPIVHDGHIVPLRASMGLAISEPGGTGGPSGSGGSGISPGPGISGDELLLRAEMAIRVAKRAGTGGCVAYTPAIDVNTLGAELQRALDEDQLVLHYQPIIDIASGDTVGLEALVRWQHPERGLVPPLDFIPLAEETGLILPLGNWVLRTACAQVVEWGRTIPAARTLTLSVNVAPRQVRHPSLVSEVSAALRDTGFDPRRLIVEITEDTVLSDDTPTVAKIEALRSLGIRVAVDDFGTGYSSLRYLRRLPIDVLKIDRSLVADLVDSADGRTICGAVVSLGAALQMDVVAEGIENTDHLAALREMQCSHGQGYHFARPQDATRMAEFLQQSHQASSTPS